MIPPTFARWLMVFGKRKKEGQIKQQQQQQTAAGRRAAVAAIITAGTKAEPRCHSSHSRVTGLILLLTGMFTLYEG